MITLKKYKHILFSADSTYLTIRDDSSAKDKYRVALTKNSLSFDVYDNENSLKIMEFSSDFPSFLEQLKGGQYSSKGFKQGQALIYVKKIKGSFVFFRSSSNEGYACVANRRHEIQINGRLLPLDMDPIKGRLCVDLKLNEADEYYLFVFVFAFLIWLDEW